MKVLTGICVLLGMFAVLNAIGDGPKLRPLRPTPPLPQGMKGTPGREPAIRHPTSLPDTVPPCRYFEPEWTMPNDGHTIYAACAVQDTLVFKAHGYYAPNRILIYRISDFALVDSFLTPQVSDYGYVDFYYDKNEDVLYAGAWGLTNQFDRWNATTHTYLGRDSITGSQTPGSYCFAITGDGDSLYISGFDVGIYKCAKTGGNSHLVVVSPPQSSTMGLAMARSRGIMFVSGGDLPANLYQYDCRNWAQILDTTLDADWSGCELFHGDTFMVAVVQALDDEVHCYRLFPAEQDIGVDGIELPTGIIQPGTHAPRVRVKNYGTRSTPAASAMLTITGGYVNTTPVPALNPGDTAQLTFADWTPSQTGIFTLRCTTLLAGDQRARNDVGVGLALIPDFVDSFESSDANYAADPSSNAWTWGVPQSPRPTAHSGSKVWGGPLAGSYPDTMNWKLSTCRLLAMQDNPIISFYQWYNLESSFDGGNCKYSTDGGGTWNLVTPLATFGATYNNTAAPENAGIPGERCFSGGPTGWEPVACRIPVTAGTQFLFRWHEGSDPSMTFDGGWVIDDVGGVGCRRPIFDLAITSIPSPGPVVRPGIPVPIQIRVSNYGDIAARFDIGVRIANTVGPDTLYTGRPGCSLAPGGSQTFQMQDVWVPVGGSIYVLRCSTLCDSTGGYAKDTATDTIYCGTVDCAVTAIIAPVDTIDTSASVAPAARVRNDGTVCVPFKVFFRFDSTGAVAHSYFDSLIVTGLAPDSERVITFSAWPFPHPAQTYATRCSVYALSDTARGNNVAGGAFTVRGRPLGIVGLEKTPTYSLSAAPNPSSGAATVCYSLTGSGNISLGLYDVTGKQVGTLASGYRNAGVYSLPCPSRFLPKGIYILKLASAACGTSLTQKLILE